MKANPEFIPSFLSTSESINSLNLEGEGTIKLDGYLPKTAEASCPDHCPDNVQRAFIEAEKALQGGLFPLLLHPTAKPLSGLSRRLLMINTKTKCWVKSWAI